MTKGKEGGVSSDRQTWDLVTSVKGKERPKKRYLYPSRYASGCVCLCSLRGRLFGHAAVQKRTWLRNRRSPPEYSITALSVAGGIRSVVIEALGNLYYP